MPHFGNGSRNSSSTFILIGVADPVNQWADCRDIRRARNPFPTAAIANMSATTPT
jgi:hypothetical protein